jgi:hypothetical protein
VDFSAGVVAWLEGRPESFSPLIQSEGRGVAAHYFTNDLTRCLRERDWAGLKAWLPGSGACHDVYWDDWPVLLGQAAKRLLGLLRPSKGKASASRAWRLRLPTGVRRSA